MQEYLISSSFFPSLLAISFVLMYSCSVLKSTIAFRNITTQNNDGTSAVVLDLN